MLSYLISLQLITHFQINMEQVPLILRDSSKKITSIAKKTDKFLSQDDDIFEKTKVYTKVLYDVTKLLELKSSKLTLPELIIDNFDSEQVWAGVELQNQEIFSKLESKLNSLSVNDFSEQSLLIGKPKVKKNREVDSKVPDVEDDVIDSEEECLSDVEDDQVSEDVNKEETSDQEEQSDDDILNDPDFQNMSDSDGDDLPLFNNLSEDELDIEEAAEKESDTEEISRDKPLKDRGRRTEIDDQFFKLSDMEKFHDIEDPSDFLGGNDDDEEELIDFFDDVPDGGEADMMYSDYWKTNETLSDHGDENDGDDDEEEDNDEDGEEDNDVNVNSDRVSKLLPSSDEEDEDIVKSTHEVTQDRLAKKINKMEEAAISDKSWQMGGEVSAPVRPENSLLSEHLEYDTAAKQAPVITEEVSRKLEDIIHQRIKDQAWDDVERKVKPVDDPYEYKKKLVLDQEKSKLSLAQIYEEEFMKVAEQTTEKKASVGLLDKEQDETPTEVTEIKSMMNTLFRKLDSLSHLHFTPKQNSAELKIVRNIPSIAMEEVAPVAATNSVLLAPAEVVDKKKGELVDDKEKTKTDRKREKREKKAKLKAKIKDKERKEKLVAKMNPGLGNKYSKEKVLKKLDEAEKQGQVINLNKKNKDLSVKNSKSFFSNLQDEVTTHVREKASNKKKDKNKNVNIASLKL